MNQEINDLLQAAVECSVFLSPTEPGLTYEEILEVGQRAGFQAGEVGDAAIHAGDRYIGVKRIVPSANALAMCVFFFAEEPDYRDFDALDFVVSELNARVRADGVQRAQLERSLVVERALAKGILRNHIEAAITYQIMANLLSEKDGVLRFTNNSGVRGLPSEARDSISRGRPPMRKEARARAYPIVKDVIERRTDGRPKYVEPLDAFADELDKLGYSKWDVFHASPTRKQIDRCKEKQINYTTATLLSDCTQRQKCIPFGEMARSFFESKLSRPASPVGL